MTAARFQINPQIVNESIQGEVVAIDLKTGCYYSLVNTAAEIWALLEQPATIEELVDALRTRYATPASEIADATASFIDDLRHEGLVTLSQATATMRTPVASLPQQSADGAAFTAPALQKYADMQDLLLIDPIHEVGEAGWPTKAAAEQKRE